jgi:soluble epoxide hydrolase / lipid-phosphate phosphatase
VALWYPQLVTYLFCVCTPFSPPSQQYKPLEFYVKQRILPTFAYQLRIADGQVESLKSRVEIKQFLNGMYGGRGPNGEAAFDTQHGVYLDRLPHLGKNRLVKDDMLDYYADQYAKNGMHGPCRCSSVPCMARLAKPLANWYRTREQNFQDELQ